MTSSFLLAASVLLLSSCSLCENVIDECHECEHDCVKTMGSFYCKCYHGHQLADDGKECIDINECHLANGGCSDRCVNTPGGHRCECPREERLHSDEKTCLDVDEHRCLVRCGRMCVNVEGTLRCQCPPGHEISEGGRSCRMKNESCHVLNGGCQHECLELLNGSSRCACLEGFSLDGDGKTCHGTDVASWSYVSVALNFLLLGGLLLALVSNKDLINQVRSYLEERRHRRERLLVRARGVRFDAGHDSVNCEAHSNVVTGVVPEDC